MSIGQMAEISINDHMNMLCGLLLSSGIFVPKTMKTHAFITSTPNNYVIVVIIVIIVLIIQCLSGDKAF